MSAKKMKTRFAPSPTGSLHLGSARTALFNWLFAVKNNGEFILRFEDTDIERSTQQSVDEIKEGLSWLGILNTSQHKIFYQSQRTHIYKKYIETLLEQGLAYKCYCSSERLDKLRADQMTKKLKPRYDGHCRDGAENHKDNDSFVIRFKNPTTGKVDFHDLIKGDISIDNSELDDVIIQRSNGIPTYNFVVTIDDMLMEITHIVRGDDHINNTPRQINILKALNGNVPYYAHMPMILGTDGKRLSKRHGATSILQFMQAGYLPQSMRNALLRLGWSYGDQEIFNLTEMVNLFSLTEINNSAASFDINKLNNLNKYYLKNSTLNDIVMQSKPFFVTAYGDIDMDYLEQICVLQRDRHTTIVDIVNDSKCFFIQDIIYDKALLQDLTLSTEELKNLANELLSQFSRIASDEWTLDKIKEISKNIQEKFNIKMKILAPVLRIIFTGETKSPGILQVIMILGQQKITNRLQQFLAQNF